MVQFSVSIHVMNPIRFENLRVVLNFAENIGDTCVVDEAWVWELEPGLIVV